MNNKIITDNYLNLQGETILKVQNIILDYFQRLDKMINEGNLDANLCADYLKIIVEAIKVSEKPEVWINNAYTILKQFKTWIECDNKKYHIGLIGGWCDIALSVKRIKDQTVLFSRFLESCNKYIVNVAKKNCIYVLENLDNMKASYYDVICGLSGVLIYFLEYEDKAEYEDIIEELVAVLICIAGGVHDVNGQEVVNYHIPQKNQVRENLKKIYYNGNINLGVAHGIISIAAALTKAQEKGIRHQNIQNVIDGILEVYMRFMGTTSKGVVGWPEQLHLDNYIKGNKDIWLSQRQSWCYGAAGICGTMLKIAVKQDNIDLADKMYSFLNEIASLDINEYELQSPIICHGYAGVLMIFVEAYKYKENIRLHKKIKELIDLIISCYEKNSVYGYRDLEITYVAGRYNMNYVDKNSFLEGASGIILVLLSLLHYNIQFGTYLLLE